eukprot:scaffold12517_cov101-Isochrysis_galbana.AAC.7
MGLWALPWPPSGTRRVEPAPNGRNGAPTAKARASGPKSRATFGDDGQNPLAPGPAASAPNLICAPPQWRGLGGRGRRAGSPFCSVWGGGAMHAAGRTGGEGAKGGW